jgi:hypothetical protein
LLKYAASSAIAKDNALAASETARRILHDLTGEASGEVDPCADPAAAAAIVLAMIEQHSINDAALAELFERTAGRVVACFDAGAGFAQRVDADGRARPMPPHSQAMVAGALCKMLAMNDGRPAAASNVDAKFTRAALERAWQSVPRHQYVALLPWIGWAETDYTRATGKALAHVDDLRALRDALERTRVDEQSNAAPDLIGGLALSGSGAGQAGHVRADSQSVRPAAWLAGLIRDERFTPPGRTAAALERQLSTMRFLMQLSVRGNPGAGAVMATFRNPQRAVGGLRAAPWNWDQPLPAQALALLTAVQMIQAMDSQDSPIRTP